jgi:hypothetical protein
MYTENSRSRTSPQSLLDFSRYFIYPEPHLSSRSEVNSSGSLTRGRSIKLDVVCKLRLLSSKVTATSALGSINLNTQNLGRELEDLVLYLAVLFAHISIRLHVIEMSEANLERLGSSTASCSNGWVECLDLRILSCIVCAFDYFQIGR